MDQAERLRNIIKQQNIKRHLARVITVTSGKGGVGKSNVSVNLAIQLSRLGKRVVVLDADFGLANVEVMLGLRPKYNLADMMFHGKSVQEILTPGPEDIGFISGGSGIMELVNLDKDQIQSMVTTMYDLDQLADVVLIDTGAGISDAVIDLVMCSTEVLLVATPEPTSITDAYALLKTMRRQASFDSDQMTIRMIANRVQTYEESKELYYKLNTVSRKFLQMDMEYMGAIPEDIKLQTAVRKQQPVSIAFPDAPASRAMMELATVLVNGGGQKQTMRYKGLSGLLARMFRSSRQ